MRAARVAWVLAALTTALAVADTVVAASYRSLLSEESIAVHGWPFNTFASVGGSIMAALIISRYPRHRVGWVLCVVATFASISLLTETYSELVVDHAGPGSDRTAAIAGWVSLLLGGPTAFAGLTVMYLISPDGRLLSPRWRVPVAIAGLGFGCFLTGLLLLPGVTAGDMVIEAEDAGGRTIARLFKVGLWLLTLSLSLAVLSMFVRLRRAHGEHRQQLRWIIASAVFIPPFLVWRQVVQELNDGEQTWLATVPLFAAYPFIPVCTAVAILRYRLYDIELIINRAVAFAVGALFAAGAYVVAVVALGAGLGSQTGGFWPSLIATAAVALAFQPVRRRVTRVADRAAYGARAAPYEALADFSQRLGESAELHSLLPTVAEAAGAAVSARRATATLAVHGVQVESASWPADAAPGGTHDEITVWAAQEALGTITVELPPGRHLRDGERALLRDLADQAALAFRNASLDAQSRADVLALALRSSELKHSRRRIIAARDVECRRLQSAISQRIHPLLDQLDDGVDRLHTAAESGAPLVGVEPLLDVVGSSLGALRDLSHGVFPAQLVRVGLAPALASYLATSAGQVSLRVDESARGRRFGRRVEAAAYFCCVESLADCPSAAQITLAVEAAELVVQVQGVTPRRMDRPAVEDRVAAVAGSLRTTGSGTATGLELRVPLVAEPAAVESVARALSDSSGSRHGGPDR